MISMTYGVMPTREQFDAAFERECPDGYNITLNSMDSHTMDIAGFKLGDGCYTSDQLWVAITEIVEHSNRQQSHNPYELAMDLVSSILFTLDFEWI